ncbi:MULTISPECIES: hypothetical protein [Saccharibacillus]|uniref:hypothetical protein n=1 Tax=Saccharibacillus TaxID=456492 RepID=UPI0012395B0F|nr:hypothetical protein [Saccharibacillus sp. WB 17]MWJ33914.1 hypothetical protein [Saccharibacillus sp. WB 17]
MKKQANVAASNRHSQAQVAPPAAADAALRLRALKPWAAGAALCTVLLLGGCIRFGPQADEMEQTASRQAEQQAQEESAAVGEDEQAAGAGEAGSESSAEDAEQSPSSDPASEEMSNEVSDETSGQADGTEPSAAGSGEAAETDGESSDDASPGDSNNGADADPIEVSITRTDSERTVRFDLLRLPSGYSLSSLTWEPDAEGDAAGTGPVVSGVPAAGGLSGGSAASQGEAGAAGTASGSTSGSEAAPAVDTDRVTSTYHDAVLAGESGTNGFFVDMDGQRIGYRYGEEQTGRTGAVRLDFRDGEGGSTSWESRVTLGLASTQNPAGAEAAE